jgi:hypothetical protein
MLPGRPGPLSHGAERDLHGPGVITAEGEGGAHHPGCRVQPVIRQQRLDPMQPTLASPGAGAMHEPSVCGEVQHVPGAIRSPPEVRRAGGAPPGPWGASRGVLGIPQELHLDPAIGTRWIGGGDHGVPVLLPEDDRLRGQATAACAAPAISPCTAWVKIAAAQWAR